MSLALHAKDMDEIKRALADLLARSEAEECLLCDSGGHILAHEGVERQDLLSISALAAGVFMASRELARMLGEQEFDTVFHQGEHKSIFFQAVTPDVLLIAIFSSQASLGLVKLYSASTALALQPLFDEVRRNNEQIEPCDHRAFVLKDGPLFSAKPAT